MVATAEDITYEQIRAEWSVELAAIERAAFPTAGIEDLLVPEEIEVYCDTFPEGGFVALHEGRPVGMGVGIFIDFDFEDSHHSLDDLIGENSCGNHSADGDWYYGITIAVDPGYRRLGIGHQLYIRRKDLVRRFAKAGIVAGGVIPGYKDHIHEMSADDYVDKVERHIYFDVVIERGGAAPRRPSSK